MKRLLKFVKIFFRNKWIEIRNNENAPETFVIASTYLGLLATWYILTKNIKSLELPTDTVDKYALLLGIPFLTLISIMAFLGILVGVIIPFYVWITDNIKLAWRQSGEKK